MTRKCKQCGGPVYVGKDDPRNICLDCYLDNGIFTKEATVI